MYENMKILLCGVSAQRISCGGAPYVDAMKKARWFSTALPWFLRNVLREALRHARALTKRAPHGVGDRSAVSHDALLLSVGARAAHPVLGGCRVTRPTALEDICEHRGALSATRR
jgi:hypothetical protein